MTSIGVIGGGVLGAAVARGFMEHGEVRIYDVVSTRGTCDVFDAATADIVFICLPTPSKPDGACDTTAIDEFLETAHAKKWWTPDSCYVIRSTVPVGYTEDQGETYGRPLIHSPEFLTARCSHVDFQTPSRNLIGTTRYSMNGDRSVAMLRCLYATRFPGVPIISMPARCSELVKLACNAFFATKVTFFNVLYATAVKHRCSAALVWEGLLSDGRIAHAHTKVPGPSGEMGYGGACLPKDLANFRQMTPEDVRGFIEAIERTNDVIRGAEPEPAHDDAIPQTTMYAEPAAAEPAAPEPTTDERLLKIAGIAAVALTQGVRPAMASGLLAILRETGFATEADAIAEAGAIRERVERQCRSLAE